MGYYFLDNPNRNNNNRIPVCFSVHRFSIRLLSVERANIKILDNIKIIQETDKERKEIKKVMNKMKRSEKFVEERSLIRFPQR